MFAKHSDENYIQLVDGISIKTLVHGEKTLMTEFRLKGGAALPAHKHPHEQTGYLVSGKLRIGSEAHTLLPGASWSVPSDVEHSAEVLEDSVAIEVFSPLREDYLGRLDKAAVL